MARHTTIDLGLPTEDLPEWSVSLDFSEKVEEEKKEKVSVAANAAGADFQNSSLINTNPAVTNSGSSSALDSGFSAEFVLDGDITSPSQSQDAGLGNNISSVEESQGLLGGFANSVQGSETDTLLDGGIGGGSYDGGLNDSISTLGTGSTGNTQEESNMILGGSVTTSPEPATDRIGIPEPESAVQEQIVNTPEPVPVMQQSVREPEPVLQQPTEPETVMPEAEIPEPVVAEPTVSEPAPEPATKEVDEVEERLNHLANSMKDWEQSEHALSEAAAMLSRERHPLEEDEDAVEEKPLTNLMKGLDDITKSLDRMSASAREDLADVIEHTQKSNELSEAIDISAVEHINDNNAEAEIPVQTSEIVDSMDDMSDIQSDEPDMILDSEPTLEIEPEMTLGSEPVLEPEPEEETPVVFSPEMQISNDMFDLGVDLSDDEMDYSDENIDLDAFSGSIKDAEQFNTTSENSIDLDAAGTEEEGQSVSNFDMSNLVAAAMSNLNRNETEPEAPEQQQIQDAEEEVAAAAEPEEESEGTLEFMTADEPEEESEGMLEFMTADEPEEAGVEESVLAGATFEETFVSEEPEAPVNEMPEPEIPEVPEEKEPEEVKLVFEPVYPEGAPPSIVPGIMDEISGDDVSSMIIEDYSEVPTVSDIEDKLSKQEKEKKRSKGKKKQDDGFAYSLDDLNQNAAQGASASDEPLPVFTVSAEAEAEQAQLETAGTEEVSERQVFAKHVVHKIGKIKRSYYRLTFQ